MIKARLLQFVISVMPLMCGIRTASCDERVVETNEVHVRDVVLNVPKTWKK